MSGLADKSIYANLLKLLIVLTQCFGILLKMFLHKQSFGQVLTSSSGVTLTIDLSNLNTILNGLEYF